MSTLSAKASAAKRQAAGYRVVRVFLPPEAAAALDALTKRDSTTMTEAITAALVWMAASRPS